MGIFFEIGFFRFASNYRGFEGCWWFRKVSHVFSLLALVAAYGNYFFDNRQASVWLKWVWSLSSIWHGLHTSVVNKRSKSAMWIFDFSCLPKSRESKVFYAKNTGYFIRIIFILYVFYWFFVVFFNLFTMYWWLINFLCIFMPPCLPN